MGISNMADYWMQSLNICRQNPYQFLLRMKFNIPSNIQNDPDAITQYLMNSGRMSQEQYQFLRNFKDQVDQNLNPTR